MSHSRFLHSIDKQAKTRKLAAFICLLLIVLTSSQNTFAQCDGVEPADSLTLLSLLEGVTVNNTNWKNDLAVSEWNNVTLSEDGCNVVGLKISFKVTVESLMNAELPFLEYLVITSAANPNFPDVDFPSLKSLSIRFRIETIPDFSFLPNLEIFEFKSKDFGPVPNFTNLPNLKKIRLEGIPTEYLSLGDDDDPNAEEGQFYEIPANMPNLEGFTNVPNLEELEIDYVDVDFLGDLSDLPNLLHLRMTKLDDLNSISLNLDNYPLLQTLRLDAPQC